MRSLKVNAHRAFGVTMALVITACMPATAQTTAETATPAVETAAVTLAPITRKSEFVGTVEAIQQVDLVARVEGFLEVINFVEGSFVKSGSNLFEIEKDTYRAALDGAQATLDAAVASKSGAEANLKQTQLTLTRQQELLRTGDVPQSTVDQALATRDAADSQVKQVDAQIAQAQAQVKTAQLNLSFTEVNAPISGRIGKAQITVGNLVNPSSGPLATVVQTDPIRVVFSISDREYLQVVDQLKPNDEGAGVDTGQFKPELQLSDGKKYSSPGKIAFIDTSINQSTGTIAVYAEFPNPELQLVPGQYVSVTVQSGEAQQLPVVPASAVQQDRDGSYVFVLGDGNKAIIRRVKLGTRSGTEWSVSSGLVIGEMVIVSGIQKISAGTVVDPKPATTEAQQTAPAGDGAPAPTGN